LVKCVFHNCTSSNNSSNRDSRSNYYLATAAAISARDGRQLGMRSSRQEWLGLWTENGSPRQDLQIGADGSVIRSREEVFFVGIDCRWGHVGVIKRFVGWEVTSLCYPDGCVYGEFDNWRGPECGERFWMFDKDEFYCPDVISTIRGAALHAVLHVQRAFRRRRAQASLPARAKKARHGSHRCCGAGGRRAESE
jgi:hypothetical protein